MKKIIGGKRYDTEKAVLCGSDSFSNYTDFNYWEESLYQKRTGEFFLHGEGGARTKYAKRTELNSWCGGEKLIPLTYDEAKAWAEEHLDADTYEKYFEVVEDMDKTVMSVSVPAAVADMLRKEAAKTGKAVSEIITDIVLKELHDGSRA